MTAKRPDIFHVGEETTTQVSLDSEVEVVNYRSCFEIQSSAIDWEDIAAARDQIGYVAVKGLCRLDLRQQTRNRMIPEINAVILRLIENAAACAERGLSIAEHV